MKKTKKFLAFLSSMKFGMIVLLFVLAACVAGSLITQGDAASYYTETYPGFLGSLILTLKLDDVFHCWWFIVLTAFLCLNLLGCSVLHFPNYLRQTKGFTAANAAVWANQPEVACKADPKPLFAAMGMNKPEESTDPAGRATLYGVRNRAGVWGSWLTHVGILVIIVGFALGQIYSVKYTVYGVAGQTKPVEGTNYEMTINDFTIGLRDDDTVTQYTSQVTLTDLSTGRQQSGETSVNHPANLLGMKVYQNSTGWACDIEMYVDGVLDQTEIVCAGEYTTVEAIDGLYVVFRAFYPDYVLSASGMPSTASSQLKNPAYLYMLYYGDQVLGMNTLKQGEEITVDNLTIRFTNPRPYSLLQLKRDPFTPIALIGGLILMAALFLAFYLRTEELYAVQQEDKTWTVYARSRKGGLLYREKLKEKAKLLGAAVLSDTGGDKKPADETASESLPAENGNDTEPGDSINTEPAVLQPGSETGPTEGSTPANDSKKE